MIGLLLLKGAVAAANKCKDAVKNIANGLTEIERPSEFDGYRIYYFHPMSEPCPGCGHIAYHTNDPETAFCPNCRRTLSIFYGA